MRDLIDVRVTPDRQAHLAPEATMMELDNVLALIDKATN